MGALLNPDVNPHPTMADMICSALLWLDDACSKDRWNLSQVQCVNLLGGVPLRTYGKMLKLARDGEADRLESLFTRDMIERLSLLVGIHKALAITAPAGHEFTFFNRPYAAAPLFGKSISEYLLSNGSMFSMYTVRRWLDGQRG